MTNSSKYEVNLENYSGPLDLLLHLISEKSIDIFTIDLSVLTKEYLSYVNQNSVSDIESMGEFLVMASYLVEIKSKQLLPKEPIVIEDDYENINRNNLISKLLQYKQIKEVSGFFKQQHFEGTKLLSKEKTIIKDHHSIIPTITDDTMIPISKLVSTFNKVLTRLKEQSIPPSTLILNEISPEEMAEKIIMVLQPAQKDLLLNEILSHFNLTLPMVMASFVAILDLVRQQKIIIYQQKHLDDIYLRYIEVI